MGALPPPYKLSGQSHELQRALLDAPDQRKEPEQGKLGKVDIIKQRCLRTSSTAARNEWLNSC